MQPRIPRKRPPVVHQVCQAVATPSEAGRPRAQPRRGRGPSSFQPAGEHRLGACPFMPATGAQAEAAVQTRSQGIWGTAGEAGRAHLDGVAAPLARHGNAPATIVQRLQIERHIDGRTPWRWRRGGLTYRELKGVEPALARAAPGHRRLHDGCRRGQWTVQDSIEFQPNGRAAARADAQSHPGAGTPSAFTSR